MSTHWEELDRIFAQARQLPRNRQSEFLSRACGENSALRTEADLLLSASDRTGEFLEKSAIERLAHSFASDGLNLKPGTRIGAYIILRQLGSGGAGEVWRAKDERLDRDVAIKVLLPHLSTDADTLRRFAEEARAAGMLNHPNIVIVHDVGEHEGMPYLVSECLEGRNLRERLTAGSMPLHESIAIADGIAHGLAAAHERGIVHRDLKPENTFLKSDGSVKLLDFGLAKLGFSSAFAQNERNDAALSLIAGTAAYMAPEQARGEVPDPRSDLFALGVMLYEMLSGAHPFRGASTFDTLHAILTRDPPDIATCNPRVPAPLARIVMRLLQKTPSARFQTARDLAWNLSQAIDPDAAMTGATSRSSTWFRFGILTAILLSLAVGWWIARQMPQPLQKGQLTRFTWKLPSGSNLDSPPVVAPDGRRIAFAAKDASGVKLFVREAGAVEPRPIAGTADAELPFWSPDGNSLGFFSRGQMRLLTLPNGAPSSVADAPVGRGAAWMSSGTIVFAPDIILSGLMRVPASGGAAEPATILDPSRKESSHWFPVALPDGIHFLYFVRSEVAANRGIYLGRIDVPAQRAAKRLFFSDSGAALLPIAGPEEAELVYLADGRVEARRFDLRTLVPAAGARTLDWIHTERTLKNPLLLSASSDVLAFAEGVVPAGNRLVSMTLDGKHLRAWPSSEVHNWPRVSPDGRKIARQHVDESWSQPDIWVEDLERGTVYPVLKTLEPDMSPVWSPDGTQLAFVTGHLPHRTGRLSLNIVAADGTGIQYTLRCPGDYCEPTDWSADGKSLLLSVLNAGNEDVWIVPTNSGEAGRPLLDAPYAEKDARFSPDGLWVAYVSTEAGHPEVVVHSVNGPARRVSVSGEGGTQPVWRRDGKVLHFVDLQGHLQTVEVKWTADGAPVFSIPKRSALPQIGFGHWGTQYDITPDGTRIYYMEPSSNPSPQEIQVALHWRAIL